MIQWQQDHDPVMLSRTLPVRYSGLPKMQTEVTLSTTESEYVSLSQSLRDVIPLMRLVNEIRERFDETISDKPTVRCTVFEDNSGALELANVPKMRPRTKHIGNKYHHFRDKVRDKTISIRAVATADQVADYLTKPLPRDSFQKHRNALQRWWHAVCKASSRIRECENMRFDLVACAYHVWTDCCFADQGQTSDALFLFSTVPQDLRPHHFVHVFANVYAPLSFLFSNRSMISISRLSTFSEVTAKMSLSTLTIMESTQQAGLV